MVKYCPNCAFDLSSVVSKRQETETKPVKKQAKKQEVIEEVETEEDDLITQVAKNLVLKKHKGQTIVRPKPSEAKALQLEKARAARQEKLKAKKQAPAPKEESERESEEEPQQQQYQPLYNLF